jgi:hypothetical protein
MNSYFDSDGEKIDFRRATPLLIGLHNLFLKRLNFLINDTKFVLKEMTEPVTVNVNRSETTAVTRPRGASSYQRIDNFKLDPKKFDWFLEGIDRRQLDALQAKLDLTMVREQGAVEGVRE